MSFIVLYCVRSNSLGWANIHCKSHLTILIILNLNYILQVCDTICCYFTQFYYMFYCELAYIDINGLCKPSLSMTVSYNKPFIYFCFIFDCLLFIYYWSKWLLQYSVTKTFRNVFWYLNIYLGCMHKCCKHIICDYDSISVLLYLITAYYLITFIMGDTLV